MYQTVAVSSTFTAEPVSPSLTLFMRLLGNEAEVEFAPFNQVFPTLLDPNSVFGRNRTGINFILLRWEDLGEDLPQIAANARQLILEIHASSKRLPAPLGVAPCPASPLFLSKAENRFLVEGLDEELRAALEESRGVCLLSGSELQTCYPVADYDDPIRERLAHVPYTDAFLAALGSGIARKAAAMGRRPYKVIVLDLDNTLWSGIAGEDGPERIVLDGGRLALHEFLLNQRESGMLLAICSKNNEDDVHEIFRERADMPLHLDHFVVTRINWDPKSRNLRSLADELSLSLDSFLFLDDDSRECAEIRANCPEVVTIQLPAETREIPDFLRHIWAFDRVHVTREDQQRNESYRQEQQRKQFEKQTSSLDAFIAGLELRVAIEPLRTEHVPRVSQLTQRTNQFNTTTIRRTEFEIKQLGANGLRCLTIDASDRFGDYGLVGAVMFREEPDVLVVESFLLSCRALGRGVEHAIVRRLGQSAQSAGQSRILFHFAHTPKNALARIFLESTGGLVHSLADYKVSYELTAANATNLTYKPTGNTGFVAASEPSSERKSYSAIDYEKIARELRTVEQITSALKPGRQSAARNVTQIEEARTPLDRKLAEIWADTLGLDQIGLHDNFFELGGTSLLAVNLIRQAIEAFEMDDLKLSSLLEAPTVAQFSKLIQSTNRATFSCLVPIRSKGSRRPFFCIHGAGGNVLSTWPLAMMLPDDQPFWCFQAKGLDGSAIPETVNEAAAYYVQELRKMHPEGPYLLGGGSFGGLVAYEMARQLTAQGESVGLLALFDTYNQAYGQMISKPKLAWCSVRFFFQRAASHAAGLLKKPPSEWPGQIARSALGLRRHAGRLLSGLYSQPEPLSQPVPAGPSTETSDRTGLTELLIRVRDANMLAGERYVPQPYEGKLTLFTAEEKMIEPYQDPQLGWGPVVRGEIEIHEVPGDHIIMGDAQAFADALDAALRQAQNKIAEHESREAVLS